MLALGDNLRIIHSSFHKICGRDLVARAIMTKSAVLSMISVVVSWKCKFSFAIEARPIPFTEVQPDGGRVVLMLHGDEYDSSLTDIDGKIPLYV